MSAPAAPGGSGQTDSSAGTRRGRGGSLRPDLAMAPAVPTGMAPLRPGGWVDLVGRHGPGRARLRGPRRSTTGVRSRHGFHGTGCIRGLRYEPASEDHRQLDHGGHVGRRDRGSRQRQSSHVPRPHGGPRAHGRGHPRRRRAYETRLRVRLPLEVGGNRVHLWSRHHDRHRPVAEASRGARRKRAAFRTGRPAPRLPECRQSVHGCHGWVGAGADPRSPASLAADPGRPHRACARHPCRAAVRSRESRRYRRGRDRHRRPSAIVHHRPTCDAAVPRRGCRGDRVHRHGRVHRGGSRLRRATRLRDRRRPRAARVGHGKPCLGRCSGGSRPTPACPKPRPARPQAADRRFPRW